MLISLDSYRTNKMKNVIPTEEINVNEALQDIHQNQGTYMYEVEGYKIVIRNSDYLSYRIQDDIANAIIPFIHQQYADYEIGPRVKEIYGSRCDFEVKYNSRKRTIKVLVKKAS